jgi:hypothetical protein
MNETAATRSRFIARLLITDLLVDESTAVSAKDDPAVRFRAARST